MSTELMLPEEFIFSINCYISGIISMTLTGTLICAIISKTPTEMKNYRMFLLNVSISDFLVSFATTMLQSVPDSSHKEVSTGIFFSNVNFFLG